MILAVYLLAGVFAGLVAGLLGVGGGIIVVPVLILVFQFQGFESSVLVHMAVSTSLATIIFTSISSVWSHQQKGAVLWPVFLPMALGISVGAVFGIFTVIQVDGELLKQLIGVFAIAVALKMLLSSGLVKTYVKPRQPVLIAAGAFIGWVSAMFGIGGGTLSVPYLSRCGLDMRKVVGTAAACGFPIALVGSVTSIAVGFDKPELPPWSLGFVYLPALLGVSLASVVFARVGARLAHIVKPELLRRLFAVLLFFVGVRFLVN